MTFAEGFRALAMLGWLISPPILALLAFAAWIRTRRNHPQLRTFMAVPTTILTIANWIVFAVLLSKAQTPYGEIFPTSALTHALLVLAVLTAPASLSLGNGRWRLFLANLLLITLWIGIGYAPSHFLKRWGYGKVAIDGHPTAASLFIANPWDSEAESTVLVQAQGTEDFFMSFELEGVHVSPEHHYIRLPGGAWSFKSLREMKFEQPLPPTQANEFRFQARNGAIVSVQF